MQKQLWEPISPAEVLVPSRFTVSAVLSKTECTKKLLCQAGMYKGAERTSPSSFLGMFPLMMVVRTSLYPLLTACTDKPRWCIFLCKNGQEQWLGLLCNLCCSYLWLWSALQKPNIPVRCSSSKTFAKQTWELELSFSCFLIRHMSESDLRIFKEKGQQGYREQQRKSTKESTVNLKTWKKKNIFLLSFLSFICHHCRQMESASPPFLPMQQKTLTQYRNNSGNKPDNS